MQVEVDDGPLNQELDSNLKMLSSDLNIFLENSKMFPGTNPMTLDLMFIMDCTYSMSPWIKECKQSILGILENIKRENPHCSVRMSFVGYRDIDESTDVLKFTDDPKIFSEFLGKVRATGGADLAEDVCTGFEKAL